MVTLVTMTECMCLITGGGSQGGTEGGDGDRWKTGGGLVRPSCKSRCLLIRLSVGSLTPYYYGTATSHISVSFPPPSSAAAATESFPSSSKLPIAALLTYFNVKSR